MYLKLITNNNVFQYADLIPQALCRKNELLGVVCLDDEDTALGVAVVEPLEESLEIQWLYVIPEFQCGGVGSLLLEGITEMAEAAELGSVEVYYHAGHPDEDAESIEEKETALTERELFSKWRQMRQSENIDSFLLENGFVVMREYPIKAFYLSDVTSSEYVAKHNKGRERKELKAYEDISFEKISPQDEEYVISQLKAQGFPDYVPYCSRNLSFICKKDNRPVGCILITDNPEEETLTVMALLNFVTDPICAAKLIVVAGEKIINVYPPKYQVSFVGANETVLRLVGTILDDMSRLRTIGHTTHAVFEVNSGVASTIKAGV